MQNEHKQNESAASEQTENARRQVELAEENLRRAEKVFREMAARDYLNRITKNEKK